MYEFNSIDGILHYGDEEIKVTITDIMPERRASRPTSIQHGLAFKSNWTYIYSTWRTVTLDTIFNRIAKTVLYGILGNLGIGLGILDVVVNAIKDPVYGNDNAFWVRDYVYANQNVLSQTMVLVKGNEGFQMFK